MTGIVIRADGLAKQYKLGQIESYGALRDSIAAALALPARLVTSAVRGEHVRRSGRELFWALQDVSFEVAQGEVLAIIGRNGAGKSTLLKILSRITEPTAGSATLRGRVGSLLEVGTGFHPELTGRENIYLNGAILGMRRVEIRRKFEEIVEFAGVSRFLDTPVKRYSTGMHVRLAFSVAAHLETEILLVDEVLSVGDVEFQRKCLGKMEDVTREGRTVLFVSHNLTAVRRLCPRTILLKAGKVEADDATALILNRYLDGIVGDQSAVLEGDDLDRLTRTREFHNRTIFRPTRLAMHDEQGTPRTSFNSDESPEFVFDYEVLEASHLEIVYQLVNEDGDVILRTEAADWADSGLPYLSEPGKYRSRCRIPPNLFGERRLYVSVYIECSYVQHTTVERALPFDVSFQGYNGNLSEFSRQGYIRPQLAWSIDRVDGSR